MGREVQGKPVQLSLSYEVPQFDDLLALMRHVVERCRIDGLLAKAIAMECDLAPSTFSAMLSGYEHRHFPAEKIPDFIRVTHPHGLMVVHYLVDRFLTSQETKVAQAVDLLRDFGKALPNIQRAAEIVIAAQAKKK